MFNDIPTHPDYEKYPFSDGEMMAESTLHKRWMTTIFDNVDSLTEGQDIFVAIDMLWYPVEGQVNICKAPDVMVAIGRPKGDRDSYLQWHEDNIAPQVVFEIFSRTNHRRENKENLLKFYTTYGVQEYYIYDPIRNTFTVYQRHGDKLTRLEGLQKWISPLLGIRFEWTDKSFEIYRPDGERFLTFEELEEEKRFLERKAAETEKLLRIAWVEAEVEKQKLKDAERKAQAEAQRAEAEAQRAEAEAQRAEAEAHRADAALASKKLLEEKLRALGIDPETVA